VSEIIFPLAGKRVWIAGHRGMVGSAVRRRLATEQCDVIVAERRDLDLTRQEEVEKWLAAHRLDAIVMAAAKVGGIAANDRYPTEFIYNNLIIEANVIRAAHRADVNHLLFLGSSCIYPKFAAQPIVEDALLTGPLEPTNEWYAVAKIAGIKLCQAYQKQYGRRYISAMPCNLYGPGDNFDLQSAHVLPALIRKAYEAKLTNARDITIWGSGKPRREFLHVDDCADGLILLLEKYAGREHVNVGFGEDISIADLAALIARIVGFEGGLRMDPTKPDGTPRKLMSSEKARALGWRPQIGLEEGIRRAYAWYLEKQSAPSVATV